jgi:hypothetical protein
VHQFILVICFVTMFASCQKNEPEVGKKQQQNANPPTIQQSTVESTSEGTAPAPSASTIPFVEPELFPSLKWGMNASQIRALGGMYSHGQYAELIEGSGIWQYKFDARIKQFGTYGSMRYQFPNQYEPNGFMNVYFAECMTPVMRGNELAKSLDCVELQRLVTEYLDRKYGKPSIKKERDQGGGTVITYTWLSEVTKIEMIDIGGLSMGLSFSPIKKGP